MFSVLYNINARSSTQAFHTSIFPWLCFPSDSGTHSYLQKRPQIPDAPWPAGQSWVGHRRISGLAVVPGFEAHRVITRVRSLNSLQSSLYSFVAPLSLPSGVDREPASFLPFTRKTWFGIWLFCFLALWLWENCLILLSFSASCNTHLIGLHWANAWKAPRKDTGTRCTHWRMLILPHPTQGQEVTQSALESPLDFLIVIVEKKQAHVCLVLLHFKLKYFFRVI